MRDYVGTILYKFWAPLGLSTWLNQGCKEFIYLWFYSGRNEMLWILPKNQTRPPRLGVEIGATLWGNTQWNHITNRVCQEPYPNIHEAFSASFATLPQTILVHSRKPRQISHWTCSAIDEGLKVVSLIESHLKKESQIMKYFLRDDNFHRFHLQITWQPPMEFGFITPTKRIIVILHARNANLN